MYTIGAGRLQRSRRAHRVDMRSTGAVRSAKSSKAPSKGCLRWVTILGHGDRPSTEYTQGYAEPQAAERSKQEVASGRQTNMAERFFTEREVESPLDEIVGREQEEAEDTDKELFRLTWNYRPLSLKETKRPDGNTSKLRRAVSALRNGQK